MSLNKSEVKLSNPRLKYLLFLFFTLPFLTDFLEVGHFPLKASDWITEMVMTIVISFAITIIFRQYNLLEKLTLLDHLTGIGNRRQFEIDLNREIVRAQRTDSGLILLFFDLDGFKQINDKYGHIQGDMVLIAFAQGLSDFVRKGSDFCYRFGGDEFALLLTDMDKHKISDVENEVEARLLKTIFPKIPYDVSASKGLVLLKKNESLEDLLKRADDAMYQAKRQRKLTEPIF